MLVSGAAVAMVIAALPAVAQDTELEVALGNIHFADFNDGPTYASSPTPEVPPRPAPTAAWQWGVPTSGPNAAASGSKVWATNLAGNYGANECSGLASAPIDLTGASAASVSFKHWRHMELSSATSTFVPDAGTLLATTDGGATFTRVVAPDYNTNSLSSTIRPCFDGADTTVRGYVGPAGTTVPAPTYATSAVDLSAFAGQSVQLVWVFASNSATHRAGWYLDDVAVTVDGVTTVQDFESGDGGFAMIATKPVPAHPVGWEHGMPTTGPANVTDPLWATNLDGDHGPSECAWIESEPIQVTLAPNEANEIVKATLSWKQWFRTSSTAAAGVVQIGTADGNYTIVAPESGYPAKPTSTVLDACLSHLGPGLGAFAGLINTAATPLVDYSADISEFVGQSVTIRFLFASTTSTSTNEGWYVDDVSVDVKAVAVVPVPDPDAEEPTSLLPYAGLPLPPIDGVTKPVGEWTIGGPVSTWAYGNTTTNPVGQTVFKTNLNGNHAAYECSYIESPEIAGVNLLNGPLRFEHWHRIPGTSVNVPWAAGIVLVSIDGGASWTHVNMSDYSREVRDAPTYTEVHDDCLVNFGSDATKGAYGGAKTAFGWSEVDLRQYAGAPSIKVRFAYGSDGTFAYEGWAIRAVELGGVKLL